MNIIDLSVLKKEDLTVKSLKGTEFNIPGNFSTEFYLNLYDVYTRVNKVKATDYKASIKLLKEIALEIIKLDTSKEVSMGTINEEFNDFGVLQMLLVETMKHANEITNDPNSKSPTSN